MGEGSAVDGVVAGGALLGNARSLALDERLVHFGAALIGRVKPRPLTKNDEERVERAAATIGSLTQKVPYSTVVDRARRFGNHGTSFRSSTAGTWSMGWVRLRGSVATPPSGGRSEVFQSS